MTRQTHSGPFLVLRSDKFVIFLSEVPEIDQVKAAPFGRYYLRLI
jgi:hypothetical protein